MTTRCDVLSNEVCKGSYMHISYITAETVAEKVIASRRALRGGDVVPSGLGHSHTE